MWWNSRKAFSEHFRPSGARCGALAGVLAPDFTFDGSRGLARTRSIRFRTDNRAGTRLGCGAELLVLDQQVEDYRAAPAGAGGLDTVARRVFRQMENLGAIAEERAVALGGVEGRSAVERGPMGHELDQGIAPFRRALRGAREDPGPRVRRRWRGCSCCHLGASCRIRSGRNACPSTGSRPTTFRR